MDPKKDPSNKGHKTGSSCFANSHVNPDIELPPKSLALKSTAQVEVS